jgi:pyruvate kinase
MASAETTAHMASAETAAHMASAETAAHMAATECQGGTARQRRAKRGRGQQYTEASHRSLLTGYESKDSRGRNNGLVEIVS